MLSRTASRAALLVAFASVCTISVAQERVTAQGVRVEATRFKDISAYHMDGRPPAVLPVTPAEAPVVNTRGVKILADVPAYTWCYGCANTAAAMITGYYDRRGYPSMFTGAVNAGVAPMANEIAWPDTLPNSNDGECPYAASHKGVDGRAGKGHVDDFWFSNGSLKDPYKMTTSVSTRGWTIHSPYDCTGDYMWTSWGEKNCKDGDTIFYTSNQGWKTYDYDDSEPDQRDGLHGFKLWINSRGYSVTECYNQLIWPTPEGHSNYMGFTWEDYMAEINAGRPVLLSCGTHMFVGYGYNTAGKQCYIRTTWDNDTGTSKKILWGGSYGGQRMWAVSVMDLAAPPAKPDLLVKAPYDDAYGGGNAYTAPDQAFSRPCKPSERISFLLQAQNDHSIADSFRVTGTGGNANWAVSYFDTSVGGANKTAVVTGAGWEFGSLEPTKTKVFRVEITPSAALAEGANYTISVTLRSLSAIGQSDVVNITTRKYNSGIDPTVTPRDPRIAAASLAGDKTKADVTVFRSPEDPFACTYYTLYRKATARADAWVEIGQIKPTTGAASYVLRSTGLNLTTNTYRFGVRAYNGAGRFSNLVACNLVDPGITPRDPAFTASRLTGDQSSATLLVTKSPDDPAGCVKYQIQRRYITPTTGTWLDNMDIPATGLATYSRTDGGLDIETAYQYRVRACNGTLYSAWVQTTLKNPSVTPRPPEMTAKRLTTDATQGDITITKSLDDPAGCTHYVLQRRTVTTVFGLWVQVGTDIAATGKATYAVRDTGLAPATNYQYQVRAYNSGKGSGWVQAGLVNTGTTPAAPTISAVRHADNAARADITVNKSPDDPFGVTHYKLEKLCTTGDNVWTEMTDFNATGGAVYTALDEYVKALESYKYRIRAFNVAKASPYANCDLTDPHETVAKPGYLHVAVTPGTGGKSVDFTWSKTPDDPDDCTGYEIYVRNMDPMGEWLGPIATQNGCDGSAEYTTTMDGFPAYSDLRFGVRAMNGADNSALVIADLTTTPTAAKVLTARVVALGTAAGGAQVVVTLASDASVTAEILNLAGRTVGRICTDKAGAAGSNVLLWDGKGSTGTRVPGGKYLVRVTARKPDGQQAQVIVPLNVRR